VNRVVQESLVVIGLLLTTPAAVAQKVIAVPEGKNLVMIDGKLNRGEWDDATQFGLGDLARVYVKQSHGYVRMTIELLMKISM